MNTPGMHRAAKRIVPMLIAIVYLPVAAAHQPRTISIANVEQLYAAVNDTTNTGATLILKAGTYVLTAEGADGLPRAKGGRIELQPDMSLRGSIGDRSAVTIDAYNLPVTSFPATTNGVATGPSAAVRMGLGVNTLSWLTVRDARFAQANIDSGLQPLDPATAHVRIAHLASSGSTRGVNLLNFGPQSSGQVLEADIIDCQFFDNVLNLSEGIRIGNFQGARDSIVNARMTGNASWGQKQGRLIVNNRANNSKVNVTSIGNAFFDNGGGTIIVGGLSSNNTRADGNTINFDSLGDLFVDNVGVTEFDRGGLVILGTEDISGAGGGSSNTVNVTLRAPRLRDNQVADLAAIGARWLTEATAANNQNNHVTVKIHYAAILQGRTDPVESFADSVPATPNHGNSVTVIRCGLKQLLGGRLDPACFR